MCARARFIRVHPVLPLWVPPIILLCCSLSTCRSDVSLDSFTITPTQQINPSNPSVTFTAQFSSVVGIDLTSVSIKYFDAAGVRRMASAYHGGTNPHIGTYDQTRSLSNVLTTDGTWTVVLEAKDVQGSKTTWTAADLDDLGLPYSVVVSTIDTGKACAPFKFLAGVVPGDNDGCSSGLVLTTQNDSSCQVKCDDGYSDKAGKGARSRTVECGPTSANGSKSTGGVSCAENLAWSTHNQYCCGPTENTLICGFNWHGGSSTVDGSPEACCGHIMNAANEENPRAFAAVLVGTSETSSDKQKYRCIECCEGFTTVGDGYCRSFDDSSVSGKVIDGFAAQGDCEKACLDEPNCTGHVYIYTFEITKASNQSLACTTLH